MADEPVLDDRKGEPVTWDFGPAKDTSGNMATKADLQRLEAMFAANQRKSVDPASLTNDDEREVAAILEKLEKNPVAGFQAHNEYIAKKVTGEVARIVQEQFGQMRNEQQLGSTREKIVNHITVGLNEQAKDFMNSLLEDYDMAGLTNLSRHKPTLDALRHASENVAGKSAGVKAPVSGGTGGGNGQPPANITNDQEADAQEMFKNLGSVTGMTIEKCRDMVSGVKSDPANYSQKSPGDLLK